MILCDDAWSDLHGVKLIQFLFKGENKVKCFEPSPKSQAIALFFIALHDFLSWISERWFLGKSMSKKCRKDPLKCLFVFFTSNVQP